MRPLRLLLALSSSLIAVTLLLYVTLVSHQGEQLEQNSASGKQGGFKALLSFTSPGSLFPPSAIISLTDDNSTFFLARPAAFGPTLPKDGLSSGLWIGSGFGDDTLGKGELGCGNSLDWHRHGDDIKLGSGPVPTETFNGKLDEDRTGTVSRTTAVHDIQSLQESAEIDGKVVLLKRGQCGFLAKVLWAQKRGAVAVIVGDNVRGGALIRMYAQGDTSNVTIPSLFTSHTTAHLLSSLLPGGAAHSLSSGIIADIHVQKNGEDKTEGSKSETLLPSKVPLPSSRVPIRVMPSTRPEPFGHVLSSGENAENSHSGTSWPDAILSALGKDRGHVDHLDNNDWDNDQKVGSQDTNPANTLASGEFTVDEQSWRDIDLSAVATPTSRRKGEITSSPTTAKLGGNASPGSGEYSRTTMTESERKAWWKKWFRSSDNNGSTPKPKHAHMRSVTSITDVNLDKIKTFSDSLAPHEGLWVTLTPTNVSTSPFFDTLLVLVVSPLVTLTVVYALLLLRSRIRRRRWRAPKSLVERLPVRTYQTISDSITSATPSASSPTTPLLQHSSNLLTSPTHSRNSCSDGEEPATSSAAQNTSRIREEEKRETGLAEWRRRYGGRQRECVVCLDEYVDGISQVMSLPCGHEFHADCM